MLLMEHPYIRGEDFTDYTKILTCNILYAYMDAHTQRLIDKYPGDGVKFIKKLQSQCENMNFKTRSGIIDCFSKYFTKEGIQ